MTKVEWTLVDRDDLEHLVSIFLCREHPSAQRIKPQHGDGGIDVFVPVTPNRDTVDVYQVKAFKENIDDDRKKQITGSFKRIVAFSGKEGFSVRNWYLVAPFLPMNKDEAWLRKITKGESINCEWRGLSHLDAWASKYPEVVDYYIHDDSRRLERRVADLSAVLRSLMQAGNAPSGKPGGGELGISPGEVRTSLASLGNVLNDSDPLFRYGFSVYPDLREIQDHPFLVAAEQIGRPGCYVTVEVFARFAEALNERPIPIKVSLAVEPGSKLEKDFFDFQKYGKPFSAPMGSVTAEADLPGGLAKEAMEGASLLVGPTAEDSKKSHLVRLQILDSSDSVIDSCMASMEKPTFGVNNTGSRVYGVEENGVLDIEMLADFESDNMNLNVRQLDLSGKWPGKTLAPLRFLSNFKHPNKIRFAKPYGPVSHGGIDIPEGSVHSSGENLMLEFAEALEAIQGFTDEQVTIPDMKDFSIRDVREYIEVGRLLSGEVLTKEWDSRVVHLHPGKGMDSFSSEGNALLWRFPISLRLGGEMVEIGVVQYHVARALVDSEIGETVHGDHVDVVMRPFEGCTASVRMLLK
ncbi:hypothetical protein ACFW53_14915 [Nocardiopsis dassonvillei]|uniref:hypothetical protein n=1 Tax=Nocardiopsis dassonvillei TaxID=2014 RepID=UPI0036729304